MKTTILMIRHGESVSNVYGVYAGQVNYQLSPKGFEQAKLTAEYLKNVHIDAFYSSDLDRAYDTVRVIAEHHNMLPIREQGLREIFAGEWEGKKFSELPKLFPSYSVWLSNIGRSKPEGGESAEEVRERLFTCIKRIAEKHPGQTVCIGTHAVALRAFASKAAGQTLDEMRNMPWASNASVSVFEYENGSFTLVEYSHDEYIAELKTSLPKTV